MCERWATSFVNFMEDMGPAPSNRHTVERNDSNGNYEPSNCRWATQKEQTRNTSRTRRVTFMGETKSLAEWCEKLDLPYWTMHSRIARLGWDPDRAFNEPVGRHHQKKSEKDANGPDTN